MIEKLKAYCEFEYNNVLKCGFDAEKATTRCYGAMMFVFNFSDVKDNEKIGKWWDDEMLPKFRKLEMKGR